MVQKFFFISACFVSINLFSMEDEIRDISSVSSSIIEQALKHIKEYKEKSLGIPIIAIAGCSAVGKTDFTKALQQAFKEKNIQATILRHDDFMNPAEKISDYIIHPHLDHKKLWDFLRAIKNGERTISKPKFDWEQHAIVYQNLDLITTDIILFEGIYTLSGKESYNFITYSSLKIFIYANEEDIIAWNWQRENSGKCSHIPRNREKFDRDIAWDMEDYHKNILPTKIYADFVIQKDKKHNYSLRRVNQ